MNSITHSEQAPDASLVPREFSAPARVNLIGEHTDYTGGFVLPMAIPFATSVTISPGADGYRFLSEAFSTVRAIGPDDTSPAISDWSDYPVGVLRQLQALGITPPSFDLFVRGNIPLGSGLSSSASIEVVTAVALLAFSGHTMSASEIAVLCRRAENEYVHSPCGIMDQFVITAAVAEHALMLNTGDLTFELLPLNRGDLRDCCVVVANSMVKHSIAGGDYGVRRREVEAGQAVLREKVPGVGDLGDATLDQLEAHRELMSPESYKRCHHIISENGRVLEARDAMMEGNAVQLGDAMTRSHTSQRDDFKCSVDEIDFLVETALQLPGCFGARLTGGGFGGCTVNLVQVKDAEAFTQALKAAYKQRFEIDAEIYVCNAVDGAVARLAKQQEVQS
jgi:galactokinase